MVYYNEFDPAAADWLRQLMAAGFIPEGHVDERSITEVDAASLRGYAQCHFFAGIGGWPLALSIAGWGDRPVWTGSCPCQPFSSAGKGLGEKDPRHLWPEFRRLIAECRPPVVFGEQVARKRGLAWLAGVRADLEAAGYAVGGSDLPACSQGSPHIRNRLFWVADALYVGGPGGGPVAAGEQVPGVGPLADAHPGAGGILRQLADADRDGCGTAGQCDAGVGGPQSQRGGHAGVPGGLADPAGIGRQGDQWRAGPGQQPIAAGDGGLGDAGGPRRPAPEREVLRGPGRRDEGGAAAQPGPPAAHPRPWDAFAVVECKDGKVRRVEPGVFPLADGLPGRVGLLRGYGNAIVPQVAAWFIKTYMSLQRA